MFMCRHDGFTFNLQLKLTGKNSDFTDYEITIIVVDEPLGAKLPLKFV